jgi:PadR family transcriptional regulator PadR
MFLDIRSGLLEGIVLAAIRERENEAYGYEISRRLLATMEIPVSSTYQILRRLRAMGFIYYGNIPVRGRNRKVYSVNKKGCERLDSIRLEWNIFSEKIYDILLNNKKTDSRTETKEKNNEKEYERIGCFNSNESGTELHFRES